MNLATRALLALALVACQGGSPPVIVHGDISGPEGNPLGFVVSNLRQTVAGGKVSGSASLIEATSGLPLRSMQFEAGKIRCVDRDTELDITLDWGDPVPAVFKVLFPTPGSAERLGITFE